jgi:microcin C transport system substrate-binding protein
MKRLLSLFLLLAPAFVSPASAAESFGLAMHGAPKYDASARNLDYVNPDAPKGGTLKQAALGTFDTLNPFSIKGIAPREGMHLAYDRLMQRVWDEPFTLYPLIAERADVPPDRSSVTFHINPKARFQDGSAITADDVIFSWQALRDNGSPNMRSVYKLAAKAEKTGDLTVRFAFGPGYNRETVMIFAMMPVFSKKWWQGRRFDATVLETPVLTGPYKVAEIDAGHRIVFRRDPDYWAKDLFVNRGQYNFDRIIYDFYRDDTVAFEAFKAGAVDLRREYNAGKWAAAYDFPAVKNGGIIAQALPHRRPEPVNALIFNTRRAPFDDRRVREALEYAIDADWINRNLFHGEYRRIASFFPNSPLAASGLPDKDELAILEPFRKELPPEVFGPAWQPPATGTSGQMRANLKKADELLKAAGWIVKNGVRVRADNPSRAFRFEIIISAPEDEKIALAFVGGLRRLGIEAAIRRLDSAAFQEREANYDYDMILDFWRNSLSPGTEQTRFWSCEAANHPLNFNYAGACDPAIDSVARSIADADTAEEMTAQAHALDRILTREYYAIPLFYNGRDFVAYRSFIHHPAATPLYGMGYGMVLETWWAQTTGNK